MIDEASSRSRAASTPSSCYILIREKSRPARRDTTFCVVASPLDLAACPPIHWRVGDKAVSTPTIAIQKPETVVLGGISISPASGVTTSIKRTVAVHEEQPVTRTPVAITEKKPITLATVKSVSSIPASEIPSASPTGESPGYIFRGIPIKM